LDFGSPLLAGLVRLNVMRSSLVSMRSSLVVRASDCQCTIATVLGSVPASVGTVESEGRQMKQC
jgi:hypothetical protein